ncbi:MAG: MoxR family ATPase [Planctomycetaceae bacterium]|jgi:MoxR-like ATPase|nr:MoxR family ATPase [Planctomycetaceae bacterium]
MESQEFSQNEQPQQQTSTPQQQERPVNPIVLKFQQFYQRVRTEIAKVFVGQDELVTGTLVALFSGGHILIESVPGLGKTHFIRALGRALGCKFGRIQFTPDLMPSDVTGSPVFDMKEQEFRFRPGPVFTQLLLADEINRSPAKTHAALLEIMQESSVTVDGTTHKIAPPFFVMATQNPIESEGTYNLPEAQIDRFMFKLVIDYPTEEQETEILAMHGKLIDPAKKVENVRPVTNSDEILKVSAMINDVFIAPQMIDYINKIVRQTRTYSRFYMGASPRAGIALMQGSRTLAAFRGRDYVIPDDVIQLALPTLRHRVMLTAEAEIEGQKADAILLQLLRTVEVPRFTNEQTS